MYWQNQEIVLMNLQDSDDESEIKIPQNRYDHYVQSFQQLKLSVDEQIKLKYQPICIVERSNNSLIIKCKLRVTHAKQGQQKIPEEYFAVKIYGSAKQQANFLSKIMKLENCKFLVKMKEFYQYSIVLPLYQGQLKDLIVNNIQLTTPLICKVVKQCLHALAFLQKQKIVHGDIKPENILFKSHKKNIEYFVLSDFSSSFQISQQRTKRCLQTWPYRAPEWLKGNINIDNRIDIWSLGCVLFECITGQNFLPIQMNDEVVYEKMLKIYGKQESIRERLVRHSFPSQVNAFGTLLIMMLQIDPEKRPTINFLIQAFQKIQ